MKGELERYGPELRNILAQEDEFMSYPLDIREAALEYARGLQQAPGEPEPELEGSPQFILIGTEQQGRAVLFASTDVVTTRFARKQTGVDRVQVGQLMARLPRMSILVGAELRSFEQHIGSDYYQALATLLADWERKKNVRQRAESRAQLPPGV